jgi:xylose isomerase
MLIKDGVFEKFIEKRYESYNNGIGIDIVSRKIGFKELEAYTLKNGEPKVGSAHQEMLESILNQYLIETK